MEEVKKNADILTGIAEIAAYMSVTTRTVCNYEKHGLPVKRPIGKGGPAFASKKEIDEWRMRDKS